MLSDIFFGCLSFPMQSIKEVRSLYRTYLSSIITESVIRLIRYPFGSRLLLFPYEYEKNSLICVFSSLVCHMIDSDLECYGSMDNMELTKRIVIVGSSFHSSVHTKPISDSERQSDSLSAPKLQILREYKGVLL